MIDREHIADDHELRQKIARLQAQAELLDLVHDAIFVRDRRTSRIMYWNRGAELLYGYTSAEAVGHISHELLHTRFSCPLPEIEEEMARRGYWEGELVQMTRDGREVIVESRWAMQYDDAGQGIAFLEVNRDVSERKRVQAELDR